MAFNLSNLINLVFVTVLGTFYFMSEQVSLPQLFVHFCYGSTIALLLIPLHEVLHAIAYKYVGATKTSYMANLKKFYFAAMAHNFVTSRSEFRIVALLPFACISAACIAILPFLPPAWAFTAASTLLTHTVFCSGDFALLSYFEIHQAKRPITYDDAHNKISYFYAADTSQTG